MVRQKRDHAIVAWPPFEFSAEQKDFLRRRTMPFLDHGGLEGRSLSFVLQEVYLQGLADAVAALAEQET